MHRDVSESVGGILRDSDALVSGLGFTQMSGSYLRRRGGLSGVWFVAVVAWPVPLFKVRAPFAYSPQQKRPGEIAPGLCLSPKRQGYYCEPVEEAFCCGFMLVLDCTVPVLNVVGGVWLLAVIGGCACGVDRAFDGMPPFPPPAARPRPRRQHGCSAPAARACLRW